jgi:thioredoxin 2
MGPEFAKATQSLEPTVRCLKLDTETHSSIAEDLGIRSIPTLLLFVKGREVARISGAQPASEILRWVHTHL